MYVVCIGFWCKVDCKLIKNFLFVITIILQEFLSKNSGIQFGKAADLAWYKNWCGKFLAVYVIFETVLYE